MNKMFHRQGAPAQEDTKPSPGVYVLDAKTNTFGFAKKGRALPGVVPELTADDRRRLAKRGYGNLALMERAKEMYAAGASIRQMSEALNISPDYVKGIRSCFSVKKV